MLGTIFHSTPLYKLLNSAAAPTIFLPPEIPSICPSLYLSRDLQSHGFPYLPLISTIILEITPCKSQGRTHWKCCLQQIQTLSTNAGISKWSTKKTASSSRVSSPRKPPWPIPRLGFTTAELQAPFRSYGSLNPELLSTPWRRCSPVNRPFRLSLLRHRTSKAPMNPWRSRTLVSSEGCWWRSVLGNLSELGPCSFRWKPWITYAVGGYRAGAHLLTPWSLLTTSMMTSMTPRRRDRRDVFCALDSEKGPAGGDYNTVHCACIAYVKIYIFNMQDLLVNVVMNGVGRNYQLISNIDRCLILIVVGKSLLLLYIRLILQLDHVIHLPHSLHIYRRPTRDYTRRFFSFSY